MKILISGANGFLGYHLIDLLLQKGYTVFATGRGVNRLPFTGPGFQYMQLDYTDLNLTGNIFRQTNPDVVVHTGALSKPDECEMNKELAYQNNVTGTKNLLLQSKALKTHFIFLSTDFIFDGKKGMYSEDDFPNPVNYYGQTKLLAENEVRQYPFAWASVRTSLVYGKPLTGKNNILTIVKNKLEKGEGYSVVNDQVRTPTYVGDLANGILAIIEKRSTGIYHIAGEDVLTPYEMACQTAAYLNLDQSLLKKVTAADFKEPAIRPLVTGLNINKASKELGYRPINFTEGLQRTFSDQ